MHDDTPTGQPQTRANAGEPGPCVRTPVNPVVGRRRSDGPSYSRAHGSYAAPVRVSTVAGSDSGGGAGIQADLKTMLALGVHGMSVVTAVTAQNSLGVQGAWELPVDAVRAQFRSVVDDIGVARGQDRHACLGARWWRPSPTCSPACRRRPGGGRPGRRSASTATPCWPEAAVATLRTCCCPVATVVTPNLYEVALLTGIRVQDEDGPARGRGGACSSSGPRWVLVKGGHLAGEPVDLLTDGASELLLRGPRYDNRHTHGTGCTLASALASDLALGRDVPTAAREAKAYVTGALAAGFPLGAGVGPVRHGWRIPNR